MTHKAAIPSDKENSVAENNVLLILTGKKIEILTNKSDINKAEKSGEVGNVRVAITVFDLDKGLIKNGVLGDLKKITSAVSDPVVIRNTLCFSVKSNNIEPLKNLAEKLGTTVHEKTSNRTI